MIEELISMLNRKHLIILGKTEQDRAKLIDAEISRVDYESYRFPKGVKKLEDYVDFVRAKKLYNPWYTKKGRFGINQVMDFHSDWISANNSLVVLEEFQDMEEVWKLSIMRSYLDQVAFRKKNQKVIHLVITLQKENDLLSKLSEKIGVPDSDNRTTRQIVDGGFELIEL